MIAMRAAVTVVAVLCAASSARAQSSPPATGDSARSATSVLERGLAVMGVDLTSSTHEFDLLPDGARIRLQRDAVDSAGVLKIRAHMRSIAHAFSRGDFTSPAIVHGRTVPGTAVMKARRKLITYRVNNLARGGEVWITTHDSASMSAIREFVKFQREDHRTGGVDSSAASLHEQHHPKKP
jgi:hypothetical protein